MRIVFEGSYKSIDSFIWEDVPDFVILTGLNGTGKSHLLELLNYSLGFPLGRPPEIPNASIEGKAFQPDEITFLKGEWSLAGSSRMTFSTVQQQKESLYGQFRSTGNYHNLRNSEPRKWKAFERLAAKLGKSAEAVTPEEFEIHFPEIFLEREHEWVQKIGEIFVNYRIDEIDNLASGKSAGEILTILGRKPWEVMRDILEAAKLPFEINDPNGNGLRDGFHLKLTHRVTGAEVSFENLSSGEKVLMSLVFYLYSSREKRIYPKLFLLDEPDAHLHPSMSRQFLDVMRKVLVEEMGVQVILTTHSPSTVALAPEEAIFVATLGEPRFGKATKDAALKLLTSGVPSFSVNYENRRQVFVESQYDVRSYERIYSRIIHQLEPEVSLSFIASGEVVVNSAGQPISSCDQVIRIVEMLREAGNKFIWGVVDWDGQRNDTDFVKVLGSGKRYSLENYLFDPLLIVALLLREKLVSRTEMALEEDFVHTDLKTLASDQLQILADFVLAKIATKVTETMDESTETVQLINGKEINLPRWFLQYHGHSLEDKVLETFPALNAIKRQREYELKNAIIEKVIDDIPDIISKDFLVLFSGLQAV